MPHDNQCPTKHPVWFSRLFHHASCYYTRWSISTVVLLPSYREGLESICLSKQIDTRSVCVHAKTGKAEAPLPLSTRLYSLAGLELRVSGKAGWSQVASTAFLSLTTIMLTCVAANCTASSATISNVPPTRHWTSLVTETGYSSLTLLMSRS